MHKSGMLRMDSSPCVYLGTKGLDFPRNGAASVVAADVGRCPPKVQKEWWSRSFVVNRYHHMRISSALFLYARR